MSDKKRLILPILTVIFGALSHLLMWYVQTTRYAEVYEASVFTLPCLTMFSISLFTVFKKDVGKIHFLYLNSVIFVCLVLFFVFVPTYSVQAAKSRLEDSPELQQVETYQYGDSLRTGPKLSFFVDGVYCFQAVKDSELVCIMVNPIDGSEYVYAYHEYEWLSKGSND